MGYWFYPRLLSNGKFFDAAGTPRAKTIEELSYRMGEKIFRKHYKNHLETWLDPDKTFAKLKELGINAVRITLPSEMLLVEKDNAIH